MTVTQTADTRDKIKLVSADTERCYQQVQQVAANINTISSSVIQVAAAAQEQHHVSEEINRNIFRIDEAASILSEQTGSVERVSGDANLVILNVNEQLTRLKG